MDRQVMLAVLAALAALFSASTAATAHEGADPAGQKRVMVIQKSADGPHLGLLGALEAGDSLVIDDAGSFLVGESRTYWTDGGRRIEVTREGEDTFLFDIDGREVRLGASPAFLFDIEGRELRLGTSPAQAGGEEKVRVIRVKRKDGEEGGAELDLEVLRGLALETGDAASLLKIELLDQETGEGEPRTRTRVLVVPVKSPE